MNTQSTHVSAVVEEQSEEIKELKAKLYEAELEITRLQGEIEGYQEMQELSTQALWLAKDELEKNK